MRTGLIGRFWASLGMALGIAIASACPMVSLAYYLRVIAAVWMRPATAAVPVLAGGAPEADAIPARRGSAAAETVVIAALAGAATVFFGIIPSPLLDVASDAGRALGLG